MKEISWTACLRLGATAAAVYLLFPGRDMLTALLSALSPLLIGGGAACVVNIPMSALERRFFPAGGRLGRCVCLTAALLLTVGVLAWLAGVILPEALQCAALLAGQVPELLTRGAEWLRERGFWLTQEGLLDWQSLAEQGLTMALEGAGSLMNTAGEWLAALTSGAANALLALVFAAYVLAEKERTGRQIAILTRRLLGEGFLRRARWALSALHGAFRTYAAGQCMEALLLGGLCLLGMLLMRLPQALTISAMVGVTAFLPLIGTPLAAAAGAAILLPGSPSRALTFVLFFLLLQQVESNLIAPRMVGASLGLPPVWMLAAVLAGGGLFGVAGAVLAVPAASALRTLLLTEPDSDKR